MTINFYARIALFVIILTRHIENSFGSLEINRYMKQVMFGKM